MYLRILAVLFLHCFIFSGVVFAEDVPESPFYIGPKASFLLVDLPEYAPIATREQPGGSAWYLKDRLTTEEGRLNGPRFGLTLGWNSPYSSSSGHPFFFEANGYASYMSNEQSNTFSQGAGEKVGWYAIDGNRSAVSSSTRDVTARSKRIVNQYGGEVLIGMQIQLDNDLVIKPYFGYSGMFIDQRFDTRAQLVGSDGMSLRETVSGMYNGLTGGARWEYTKENIEWYASTSGAVQHLTAKYQGHQVDTAINYDITHSDEHNTLAVQGKIEAGASYTQNGWTIGVTSGAEYISAVPQIIAADRSFGGFGSWGNNPTHIGWDSSMVYELGLDLSYQF